MTERVNDLRRLESRRSIRSEATEELRRSIVLGDLVPGTLYSVAQLADRLGVSRTPVREALLELASRGMVQFERNRGVRVIPSSPGDLREMFEVRLLLEVPATLQAVPLVTDEVAARLAEILDEEAREGSDKHTMQQLDRMFHNTLLRQAGNHVLVDTVDRLRDMVLVRPADSEYREDPRDFAADHRSILESVLSGDAERAATIVEAHLRGAAAVMGVEPALPKERVEREMG